MELEFTADDQAFAREVRDYLVANVPVDVRRKVAAGRSIAKDEQKLVQRVLCARNWAAPSWPVEWGGQDWTPARHYLFYAVLEEANVPPPLLFNVAMVGPVIIAFGSEEQKRRFLPGTLNLDIWWCQGFSEPGAGSDLASLRLSARRKGDAYIVDGQKTWTTGAHNADWIFCLVRTDPGAPKQQDGISFLLIDMRSKGIEVRPIRTIDGGVEINEVFFDDVRVPAENLVGEENKGWSYAKFLLDNERTRGARLGGSRARVQRVRYLASHDRGGGRLIDQAWFSQRLAAAEVELKALEILQLTVISQEGRARTSGTDPAISTIKMRSADLHKETTELLMIAAQRWGQADQLAVGNGESASSYQELAAMGTYLNARKVSIYGGSNEVQRQIIAKAILTR